MVQSPDVRLVTETRLFALAFTSRQLYSGASLNGAPSGVVSVIVTGTTDLPPGFANGQLETFDHGPIGAGSKVQRFTQYDFPETAVRYCYAGTWFPWRIFREDRQGTGMPEGAVSAPVGTRYTDLAATNGAVQWIKATGTGATGWRVAVGDTGDRDIRSWLGPGRTANRLRLRRIGGTCTLEFAWLNWTGGGYVLGGQILPAGFRMGPGSAFIPIREGVVTGNFQHLDFSDGGPYAYFASDPSYGWFGAITWLTSDPWPAALPGVAL